MKKGLNLPVIILFCFLFPSLSASTPSDAAVISAFAESLTGVPANWNVGTDPCDWSGIKCTAGRVTAIELNSKSIAGTLPDSLSELSYLQSLDLGHNKISGKIPSLAGLSSLQILDLGDNAFTSVPDGFFSGLVGLQSVMLDNNPLKLWTVPLDLAQCAKLQTFSAANASLTGGIPDLFGQLPALSELNLSFNSLTGGIPSSFAGSRIRRLCLNNQQKPGLLGRIDVVGAMPQLQLLWLQSNRFTGPIPDCTNLTFLTSFNLRNNQLTGQVPSSLTSSLALKDVALSNNKLQGPFPIFSGNVKVDLSNGNRFCNPYPRPCDPRVTNLLSIARGFGYPLDIAESWQGNDPCIIQWTGVSCDPQMKDIVLLDFTNQHFSGTIPPDIANISSLRSIILRDNNLTGSIPDSLTKLPQLQLLDVTNNRLIGKVPDFLPSTTLKTSGNLLLGSEPSLGPSVAEGYDSSSSGKGSGSHSGGTPAFSSTRNSSGESSSLRSNVIWGIIMAVSILVVCSACLIYYKQLKNCTRKFRLSQLRPKSVKISKSTPNVHSGATGDRPTQPGINRSKNALTINAETMQIPFQTLQDATNNFNEANIIGRGGFSTVYKGEHDGTLIAVKRIDSSIMSNKGKEDLRAEIDVLKSVRHRHLVTLLGYCETDTEGLLVYEYMTEGTLSQHLFGRNDQRYSALSWNQRLTIALDVARGVQYLHSLIQESFIHRDLKPSNILLDKDMRAKVSDFGLVKLVDSEKSMTTRVAGTFGYLAPEYVITGKVSTKVDVFAFGVILMELLTGRRALDNSLPEEEIHLPTFFQTNILNKEKFINYIDPTLEVNVEACSSMNDVADLALKCTAREPSQRPDMPHVVHLLTLLVDNWTPIGCYDDNSSMSSIL